MRYVRQFVGVVIHPQSYRNLVYLLLLLPLGTLYLMIITIGFPLALSLIPIAIGIPLLLAVMIITTHVVSFDRWLTKQLLNVDIPVGDANNASLPTGDDRSQPESSTQAGRWSLMDRSMWNRYRISLRELFYLCSKHAFGVLAWLVVTFSLITGIVFLLSPLHHQYPIIGIHIPDDIQFVPEFVYQHDVWQVDVVVPVVIKISRGELFLNYVGSPGALFLAVAIGGCLTLVSLHIINGTAQLYGRFAEVILQPPDEASA